MSNKYPLGSQCYKVSISKEQYNNTDCKNLYSSQVIYKSYPLYKKQNVFSLWPDDPREYFTSDVYKQQKYFTQQFQVLLQLFYNWGVDNLSNINLTPIETFHNQLFEVDDNKIFTYAVNQSGAYFECLKSMLEIIQVFLNDSDQPTSKKEWIYKELCENLNVCAPGVFEHISHAYNQINVTDSPENWLMELRASIIKRYASRHKMSNDIHRGVEIHVDSVFFKYAEKLNWQASIGKSNELNDIFALTANISDNDIINFQVFFEREYSPKAILESLLFRIKEVATNILGELCPSWQNNAVIKRLFAIQYMDEFSNQLKGLGLIKAQLNLRQLFSVNDSNYKITYNKNKQYQLIKTFVFNYCLDHNIFDSSKLKQIYLTNTIKNYSLLYLEGGYWLWKEYEQSNIKTYAELEDIIKIITSFNIELWQEFCLELNKITGINLNFKSIILELFEAKQLHNHINTAHDFKVLMQSSMPGEKIKYFKILEYKIDSFINSTSDIIDVFNYLTPQQSLTIAKNSENSLSSIIKSAHNLCFIMSNFNNKKNGIIIKLLTNTIAKVLKNACDVEVILSFLSDDKKNIIFNFIKVHHHELIKTAGDFAHLINKLNWKQRQQLFELSQPHLTKIVKTFHEFIMAQHYLDDSQSLILFESVNLENDLLNKSPQELGIGLYFLTNKIFVNCLLSLKANMPEIIKSTADLSYLLNEIKPEQYKLIFDDKYLSGIISSISEFQLLIKNLGNNQRAVVFSMLQAKLITWTLSPLEFSQISYYLPSKQVTILYHFKKNILKEKIKCALTFSKVYPYLNETDQQEIFKDAILKSITILEVLDDCILIFKLLDLKKFTAAIVKLKPDFNNVFGSSLRINLFLQNFEPIKCGEFCNYFRFEIVQQLKSENGYSYISLFECLTHNQLESVWQGLDFSQADIISSSLDFMNLLRVLRPEQRATIYALFKNNFINIVESGKGFNQILNHLNMAQRSEVFNVFKDDLNTHIKNAEDFKLCLNNLTLSQRLHVYDNIKPSITKYLLNGKDFMCIYSCISQQQKNKIYQYLKENIETIIVNGDDFNCIMKTLNEDQQFETIKLLQNNFNKIIQSNSNFSKDLCALKKSKHHPQILTLMLPYLNVILKNTQDCYFLLKSVPRKIRKNLFEIIIDKNILKDMKVVSIESYEDLFMLLNNDTQKIIFSCFKIKLANSINKINDLLILFGAININDILNFLNLIKEKLPLIIKNADELKNVIMRTSATELDFIINSLQENVHNIYDTTAKYEDIYYYLTFLINNRNIIFLSTTSKNINLMKMLAKDFIEEIIECFVLPCEEKIQSTQCLKLILNADSIDEIKKQLNIFSQVINKPISSTSSNNYFKPIMNPGYLYKLILENSRAYKDLFNFLNIGLSNQSSLTNSNELPPTSFMN